MSIDLTVPPPRSGPRPRITGLEIPHVQLDQFSPPHIRAALVAEAQAPMPLVEPLERAGWIEPHPISRRPEWPDTIVMLYAPRDEAELAVARTVLHASWRQATASSPSSPDME
ncbi:hypothetical protein [Nonomuraea sp. NPDC050691]|uniref:luciferase domain-containing protein n=1 Tax=Nonomuraea sp. NPDC050691 TaxID=3155661 RepID=UPI0033EFDC11